MSEQADRSLQTTPDSGYIGKRYACFVPGCIHRAQAVSLVLRHASSRHGLNYCRDCCRFYNTRTAYCPDCHKFCMSPTCYPDTSIVNTGDAFRQRHERTPRCPKVWGTKAGVDESHLWEYLKNLLSKQNQQNETADQARPDVDLESATTLLSPPTSEQSGSDLGFTPMGPMGLSQQSKLQGPLDSQVEHQCLINNLLDDNSGMLQHHFQNDLGDFTEVDILNTTLHGIACVDEDPTTWVWDGVYR